MSFKLCVIGCGGFADHVHGAAQMSYATGNLEVELAACCDLDAARAEAYARKFGFNRFYTDVEAMLDKEAPDAVFVLVMPGAAASVGRQVLSRGIPMFLEKPPSLTKRDLDGLIELATRHRVPTQVGFNRRYMPLMRRARRILDHGFSPIQQVNYEIIRFGRDDPDFSITAVHAIDAAQFLAGSPYRWGRFRFEEIEGIAASRSNVTLQAECESGTAINIHIQPMAGLVLEAFAVHGVGMSLTGNIFGPGAKAKCGQLARWQGDDCREVFTDEGLTLSGRTGIEAEVAAFCEAIRLGNPPGPSLAMCCRQVRLMEAIRNREERVIDFASYREPSYSNPQPRLS